MFARPLAFFLALFTFASATFIPLRAPGQVPRYSEHGLKYRKLDVYSGVSGKRDPREISRDPVLQAFHNIAGRGLPNTPHTEHTREHQADMLHSNFLWGDWTGNVGPFRKRFHATPRDPVLQALRGVSGRELPDAPHAEHIRELPLPEGGRDSNGPLWQGWTWDNGFFP